MAVAWYLLLAWLGLVGCVLLYHRRDLSAVWREPVLRHPVLIIESDDWGAGPVEAQTAALDRLADVLARHRDREGRHPVMTLALVLAVPDGPPIRQSGRYRRRALDDAAFAPVRAAIERGRAAGVFALQLHGLEHYWPASLMAVADPVVTAWLTAEPPQATEKLPSHLQSRWVDASVLPSRPLDGDAITSAVADEVRLFERIVGTRPRVAVPPTFVWTAEVERAWAHSGVEFVVTPGLRSACRNAAGLPDCDTGPLRNGETGAGVTYLVRDDYFEPERGHRAERALQALAIKTRQGRACLLETHRSNFIGDAAASRAALDELDAMIGKVASTNPAIRFVSTEALGDAMRRNDADWIERRLFPRIIAWRARIRAVRPFWRMARLSGLAWIV